MKILIVEDELPTAEDLKQLTINIFGKKETSIHILNTVEAAETYVKTNSVDLVLLDLNIHGVEGFNLLKNVNVSSFKTIVISGITTRAIDAYHHGILDFVPKPYSKERLEKAFNRFRSIKINEKGSVKYLPVRKRSKIEMIPIRNVKYIKGANIYVELHLRNGKKELYDNSMERISKQLPDEYFRIHKSYILDVSFIDEIHVHSAGKYNIKLSCGEVLPLSRFKYKELKKRVLQVQ